jgi:ribosomal protein S18 acetylase RimI-like enzyme
MDGQSDPIEIPSAADEAEVIGIARRIENFLPEDVECIIQLWGESLHGGVDPDRYHFLVYRDVGKIKSFACYGHRPLTRGVYDFYWLATDPETRGRGIGGKLMRRVEDEIRKLGGYIVLIETSDSPVYEKTRCFHERNGYVKVGEIADFYTPGDGLVMYQKRL